MSLRIRLLAVSLALLGNSQGALAQEVFFGDSSVVEVVQDPAAPGGEEQPTAPPTPRLEKLKRVEYDRRPSAILAAWSTPPKSAGQLTPPTAPELGSAPDATAGATPETGAAAKSGAVAGAPMVVISRAGGAVGAVSIAPAPATSVPAAAAPTGAAAAPAVPSTTPSSAAPTDPSAPAAPGAPGAPGADPEAAKKAAEEAAKKAAEEAAKKAAEAKALDQEILALQRNVTLGDWAAVKTYFAGLTDDEKKGGYERLLQSLQMGPQQKPNVPNQGQPYLERNAFSPSDVVGLAAASPVPLTKKQFAPLGQILRQALDQGYQLEAFLSEIAPHLGEPGFAPDRRQLALILVQAREPLGMAELLPEFEQAEKDNDRVGLNLLSQLRLAQYAKDNKVERLEQAWEATQAVLAVGDVEEETKKEALQRAVEIAPKIQKEKGQAWLDESFTSRPERGMEILAAIGSSASMLLAAEPTNVDKRSKLLELQTTAAKALLAASPERATQWKAQLELLASNWLREALVTYQFDESTSLGPRAQRDRYGNFFYWDSYGNYRGNQPTVMRTQQVLEIRPGDDWLAHLDPTLQPRFQMMFAQLLLKVGEEQQAFPYIERLAGTLPRQAKDLVAEFLRVWTKKHDPNSDQERSNPYIFMYGFEERANGIPLTRSKQERNLQELGEWVARLRQLPVEVDDALIASAFTTAHSTAEVYRLETVERIFGPLASLKPATLAQLVQKMRTNLVTVWRDPATQKDKKTNRHQQDIQTEVLRGYELARATVDEALKGHAASWELMLARAALEHDENNYLQDLKKDPEFSSRREAAFATFQEAARLYGEAAATLEQEKETTEVFDMWFYASLGACDLGAIDQEKLLASRQIPLIRAALEGLPGESAERHRDKFASSLFTRMGSAAPAVKFRYLREGLAITGDHKLTVEARQVFDYYKDLVTEIQLRAAVDGSDRVGHGQPFGLEVDIRHTREIERESGGFSKYLQNQNAMNFGWNYGRPLEDYRDKFEEAARTALQEQFEVLSVTFNEPEAQSKADEEYGWRVTPYAYLLLKPKGPEVDRIPPLRLDLDFLDVTGYAILPVESPAVPIDASAAAGEERPFEKLTLTQTLDERQSKNGKLLLEVKATANGLVPELESALDLEPGEFEITERADHGVSVVKFSEESRGIVSERTWTISMRAKEGLSAVPGSFTFGEPRVEAATNEHFRYVDADLASVGPKVDLEARYGEPSRAWLWWIPALLAVGAGGFFGWKRLHKPRAAAGARFPVPESLTPFTVLGYLRDIESRNGLAPAARVELQTQIETLERHYFVEEAASEPDLRRIAESWAERAR
jgi:hypothetical protein